MKGGCAGGRSDAQHAVALIDPRLQENVAARQVHGRQKRAETAPAAVGNCLGPGGRVSPYP